MKHHIFLSYSRRDTDRMQQIRDILRDAGLKVWTDEGIETGTRSWKKAIEDAILHTGSLVCVLSPDANGSEWVRAELEFAELHKKTIYLILARGDERTSIPFGFATMQWVDIRQTPDGELRHALSELIEIIKSRTGAVSLEETADETADSEMTDSDSDDETATHKPSTRPPSLVAHVRLTDELKEALEIIDSPVSTPQQRAKAGNEISLIDPRRGVGIRMDDIPDIDWIKIPAGDFIYQNGETRHLDTFYISRYPITFVQFQRFIDDPNGYAQNRWWQGLAIRQNDVGEQTFKQRNRPRENVSWYDAVAFTRWLSSVLKYEVRLPGDQEWEKAFRGVVGRLYPWGNDYISGYANVNEAIKQAGTNILLETSAVGIYTQAVSPYGVLDMAGNVWEWCASLFDYPDDNDLSEVGQRILRGGSWYNGFESAQATYRNAGDADGRSSLVGFRIARSAPS